MALGVACEAAAGVDEAPLADDGTLGAPDAEPEPDWLEEPALDGEDPCDAALEEVETAGVETFGVETDGTLTVGVDTVGVCTGGVETDGTVATGVDTVGVWTTGTDGTVTDGTVTDGTVTDGVLTLGSWAPGRVVPAVVAAPLESDWTESAASRMVANSALMRSDRRFIRPVTNLGRKTCDLRAPIASPDGTTPSGNLGRKDKDGSHLDRRRRRATSGHRPA
jgi:hypothetical protein